MMHEVRTLTTCNETTLSALAPMMKFLVHSVISFNLVAIPLTVRAQSGHKSESELARMTPEERVEEYRREVVRHYYADPDYDLLLERLVIKDGLKAVPYLVPLIDQYDPGRSRADSREKNLSCFAAEGLIGVIDNNAIRLRGSEEGRKAVDAMRRLVERLKAARFDTSSNDRKKNRYDGTESMLRHLVGLNYRDRNIQNTLRVKFSVEMTDEEYAAFSDFLVAHHPDYPSWSEVDVEKRQYNMLKNGQPYYDMYVRYKSSK